MRRLIDTLIVGVCFSVMTSESLAQDAIQLWITQLNQNKYTQNPQNLISQVDVAVNALNYIDGGSAGACSPATGTGLCVKQTSPSFLGTVTGPDSDTWSSTTFNFVNPWSYNGFKTFTVYNDSTGVAIPSSFSLGYQALASYTPSASTSENIGLGMDAGEWLTTGSADIGIGRDSLGARNCGSSGCSGGTALTGNGNVAVGAGDLTNIQGAATDNTAIGTDAGYYLSTSTGNSFEGYRSGYGNSSHLLTGNYNTGVGYESLFSVQDGGTQNSAFGALSLSNLTTGQYNVGLGTNTGYYMTTGQFNTFTGYQSGYGSVSAPLTGNYNTGTGYNTLFSIQGTAAENTASGDHALYSLTTGQYNTAIGAQAGYSITTGSNTTAVGFQAGFALTGSISGETVIGYQAAYSQTSGNANTFLGFQADYYGSTGVGNTGLGYHTLYGSAGTAFSGSYDVAIGYYTGSSLTTGTNNDLIGNNVAITTLTTGSDDILLGVSSNCDTPAANTSNYFAICATTGSTPLLSGSLSAGALALTDNGTLTVGNSALNGQVMLANTGSHTNLAYMNSDSGADLLLGSYASGAITQIGGQVGIKFGLLSTSNVFTNYLDYNISNSGDWTIGASIVSTNVNGPEISNVAAGATVATLLPDWGDNYAGIGANTAGQVSIIVDNASTPQEIIRFIPSEAILIGSASFQIPNSASVQATNSNGFEIQGGATSSTKPVFSPNKTDLNAGIGADAAGDVSIIADVSGSPTMVAKWGTAGNTYLPTLASATGAQSGYLCYSSTAGQLTYDPTNTCLVSLEEFKNNLGYLSPDKSLSEVMRLKPFQGTWKPSARVNDKRMNIFLGARAVDKVDPRLTAHDQSGRLRSVQYDKVAVLDASAIQALQAEIVALRQESTRQKVEIGSLEGSIALMRKQLYKK